MTETSDKTAGCSKSVEFKYVVKTSHLLSSERIFLFITSSRQAACTTRRPSQWATEAISQEVSLRRLQANYKLTASAAGTLSLKNVFVYLSLHAL
jgi:hypothetical protein